ncbi:response regulator [Caulobacter sp. KR2-114]|jgi:CheY-like chemotaxis protein|uniref:response regulator n=1 Tax=Caulobacter sp. KR2-114 TaxID=3400912 RepID=UPI003BFBD601
MIELTLRVLVADDHPVNRLILSELFTQLGCQVWAVADGGDALKVAQNQVFDLICLDRHMPGLSGDEVAARLRPDHHVLAWTTDLRALPSWFDGVLPKPVTLASIVAACQAAEKRARTAGRARQSAEHLQPDRPRPGPSRLAGARSV